MLFCADFVLFVLFVLNLCCFCAVFVLLCCFMLSLCCFCVVCADFLVRPTLASLFLEKGEKR